MALRDEEGTVNNWKAGSFTYAIGGAILAELVLGEAIRIDSDRKQLVELVNRQPLGDPILDECLERIANSKRRRKAVDWVASFANLRRLHHRIAETLCRRGILRADEKLLLLLFRKSVYPTLDPAPERRLRERLRRAILGDSTRLQPRTAVLVTLANAADMLPVYFEKSTLKQRKQRLKVIAEGSIAGGATRAAIEAAEAAVVAAVLVTTAVTTTSN